MISQDEVVGLKNLEDATPRPAPIGFEGSGTLHDAVRDLITTYHDLNPTTIDELTEEPSPLEFLRYVSRNRPFVVRKGASGFPAYKQWDTAYLTSVMHDSPVNVAITPHGNADSPIELKAGGTAFVKPYEREEPFSAVLSAVQAQEDDKHWAGPTHYAQTQNDNLRNEYATLFADVPSSIPWARIALEAEPDAINFWLGNSHSITALHKDNYENIYVQIRGRKHFVLLPPVEAACVNERALLAATYRPRDGCGDALGYEVKKEELVISVDDPVEYVPFATWDPDKPVEKTTLFSRYSQPLRVTLEEGDMLYLPALWYHKVSQSCNEEGICVAVNYWYDLDFSGGFWSMSNFVRGVGLVALQNPEQTTEKEGARDDVGE